MHSREGVSIEILLYTAVTRAKMHSREGVSIEILPSRPAAPWVDALPRGSEY